MYNMKLDPEQVTEMYLIREGLRKQGVKLPITKQVREAISDYIKKKPFD